MESLQPWQRLELIDEAVDDLSVLEAADKGPLAAMTVVLMRCKGLGVPDVTLGEVVRSWAATIGT